MLFFGTEQFSATILQRLLDAGFTIDAVVTKPDARSGRGHQFVASPVKELAETYGIRVLQPERVGDIADDIKSYGKPAGVLASYGKIIPQSILDLFEPGIINVHPSLLPLYRGPSPIETTLLNGDHVETGVSLMKLVAEMDAGPIYAQKDADERYTAERLYEHMADIGADLLVKKLPAILSGELQPHPQEGTPTYTKKIIKEDGIIDWHKSANDIAHQVAAYHIWPQSRTTLGDIDVILTNVSTVPTGPGTPGKVEIVDNPSLLFVQTGDGTIEINKLKPVGKKEMPIQAFLQGYKSRLN